MSSYHPILCNELKCRQYCVWFGLTLLITDELFWPTKWPQYGLKMSASIACILATFFRVCKQLLLFSYTQLLNMVGLFFYTCMLNFVGTHRGPFFLHLVSKLGWPRQGVFFPTPGLENVQRQ